MKIVRYFIRETSESTGLEGFLPLWIPRSANFDPSRLLGMMHDALEHRLCDTGKTHEEAMAFGRVLACRPHRGRSTPHSLGVEFSGVIFDEWDRGASQLADCLEPAPRVAGSLLDAQQKSEVSDFMKGFHKGLKNSLGQRYNSDQINQDDMPMSGTALYTRLARWVTIGLADARRRYGGDYGCDQVGYLFDWARQKSEQRKMDSLIEETYDGDCLRLTIDTDTTEVKCTPITVAEDYPFEHPEWLRRRISVWRRW